MVFSSHLFVFYFLPVALGVYYLSPRWARHLGLTVLSYVFYGWANPAFTGLMLFSTAIDYLSGLALAGVLWRWRAPIEILPPDGPRSRGQKIALTVSIVTNLGLLGFFKYFNFSVDSYNGLMGWLGLEPARWHTTLRVILPLGISFYTFQSMSYTIDVYRGDARAMRNPIDFACFVSMFPQLVAGPIIRFQEVADQLRQRSHTMEKFARGVALFSLGVFKKVVLANPCGSVADACFNAGGIGTFNAWYGAVAYGMQIYFDFSGYSDMAIGLGLMLGFVFPKNFDSPYKSTSITEFWQRWHISLSTWLRDYLYIPLGGNRRGASRTYVNLAMVMLIGGLWHGAAWTFVVWGAIHGGWLVFERLQGKNSFYAALPRGARVAITFLIVTIAWVFFRASNLDHALGYLGSMFGMGSTDPGTALLDGLIHTPYALGMVALAGMIVFLGSQSWDWTRRISPVRAVACLALLWVSLAMLESQSYNPFIYFIF